MSAPTFPERLDRVEDEMAGLESMIDARTRKLWQELEKLRAELAEFRKWLTELQKEKTAHG